MDLHPRFQALQELALRSRDKARFYGHVIKEKFEAITQARAVAFEQRCANFQDRFRDKHPDTAREIEDQVISPVEKQAQTYGQLSQTLAQQYQDTGLTAQQQQRFWQQTFEIAVSQPVIDYLQCHQPHMVTAIEGHCKRRSGSKRKSTLCNRRTLLLEKDLTSEGLVDKSRRLKMIPETETVFDQKSLEELETLVFQMTEICQRLQYDRDRWSV